MKFHTLFIFTALRQKVTPKVVKSNVRKSGGKSMSIIRNVKNRPTPKIRLQDNQSQSNKTSQKQQPRTNNGVATSQRPNQRNVISDSKKKNAADVSNITVALETANAIAVNHSHPRRADVIDLLRTHQKGWVDNKKFLELLKGLLFSSVA